MKNFGIIIPTYNRCEFFERTLISLINQTYKDFCVVIIDDNSNKIALKKIKKIIEKYKKMLDIYPICCSKNGGVSVARNVGLDYLFNIQKVQYITFLDSDDEYKSSHLLNINKIIEQANKKKNCLDIIQVDYKILGYKYVADKYDPSKKIHLKKCGADEPFGVAVWLNTIRSSFIEEHKILFDEKLRISEDIDFLKRLSKLHPNHIKKSYQTYIYHREHKNRLTKEFDFD